MEKRLFLAIALSILILLAHQTIFVKTKPVDRQYVTSMDPVENQEPAPQTMREMVPPAQDLPEQIFEKETDKFVLVFSNLGGRIKEVFIKDYNKKLLERDFLVVEGYENALFELSQGNNTIIYSFQDQGTRIEKRFTIFDNSYAMDATITIHNLSDKTHEHSYRIYNGSIDLEQLSPEEFTARDKYFLEFSIASSGSVLRKNLSRVSKKEFVSSGQLDWVGVRDKYFCSILFPLSGAARGFMQPLARQKVASGIETKNFVIAPNTSYDFESRLYIGPQDTKVLASFNRGFENIVSFGTFDVISRALLSIMRFVHSFIPNWGVCIILVSLMIYLVLYPLTAKSLTSMKRMQALQPEVEKLRTLHKDQPQKLNKEIMEFYRENKINPLGGCLPMFLQIPVFFALYQTLMRSIELNGATFLWIKDLSQPDRLFILKSSFPVISNEINILPLIMVVAMFFQQKLSMKSSGSSTMQEQQKMMMILFPLLFGFLFYRFPSGLTLYWVSYTILSTLSQRRIAQKVSKE